MFTAVNLELVLTKLLLCLIVVLFVNSMSKENAKRIYFNKNKLINKSKSTNPLVHLSYRDLQQEATKMNLPANLKYKILLSLVIAKKEGRQDIIRLILEDRNDKLKKQSNLSVKESINFDCALNIATPSDAKILERPKIRRPLNNLNLNLTAFRTLHSPSCSSSSCFDSFSSSSSKELEMWDAPNTLIAEKYDTTMTEDDVEQTVLANLESLQTPSPDALTKIVDLFKNFNEFY